MLKLVLLGADTRSRDRRGNTPLHYFYQCPSVQTCKDLAQALLDGKADINAINTNGETPIVKLQGIRNEAHKKALTEFLRERGAIFSRSMVVEKQARIAESWRSVVGEARPWSPVKIGGAVVLSLVLITPLTYVAQQRSLLLSIGAVVVLVVAVTLSRWRRPPLPPLPSRRDAEATFERYIAGVRDSPTAPRANPDDLPAAYSELVTYLAERFNCGRVAVLCGAGISRDSGVPLVKKLIKAILDKCDATNEESRAITQSGLPFEAFMDAVSENSRIAALLDIFPDLQASSEHCGWCTPNGLHAFFAQQMVSGKLATVATTNFDQLIEAAHLKLAGAQAQPNSLIVVRDFGEELELPRGSPTLFKLHGCASNRERMGFVMRRVAAKQLIDASVRAIEHLFATGDHDVVLVMGYSASDRFDILPRSGV